METGHTSLKPRHSAETRRRLYKSERTAVNTVQQLDDDDYGVHAPAQVWVNRRSGGVSTGESLAGRRVGSEALFRLEPQNQPPSR